MSDPTSPADGVPSPGPVADPVDGVPSPGPVTDPADGSRSEQEAREVGGRPICRDCAA